MSLSRFAASEEGASATEFALIAPALAFAMISMVDVGFALHTKMGLDHAIRSASQTAMGDPGATSVLAAVQSVAGTSFGQVSTTGSPAPGVVVVATERYCACPSNVNVSVACSSTCTGPTYTSVYYRLSANTVFDGYFLPNFNVGSSAKVRVR